MFEANGAHKTYPTATIKHFGVKSFEEPAKFTREKAGEYIGRDIEVIHVYDYRSRNVSKAENMVVMGNVEGVEKPVILVDVELEFH